MSISQEVLDRLPADAMHVSVKSGTKIPELRLKIEDLMARLKELLYERGAISKVE